VLLEDEYSYVRSAAFSTIDKFTEHGELLPDCVAIQLIRYEVELWREIGTIPLFIDLLETENSDTRSNTLSLLIKLANHSEFVALYYPDITNADMKSSVAKRLGQPSRHSSRCLLAAAAAAFDRLRVLPLPGWLTIVSL